MNSGGNYFCPKQNGVLIINKRQGEDVFWVGKGAVSIVDSMCTELHILDEPCLKD